MGCGCGGSKRAARPGLSQQDRQARRPDSGSTRRPDVDYSEDGYKWNGPVRPVEQTQK